jgi:phospholipase D1/2
MLERAVTIDREASILEPGRNCWRIERAGRAALVVDAADYYRLAREAMLEARSQILLMGWDLDTRIKLVDDKEQLEGPAHLGPFISWLARRRPSLRIHILAWGGEVYSFLGRGTTLLRMANWRLFSRNVDFQLDSQHPREASHHHKILVIDDRLAFCGGIDMTGSRWDTRAHRDEEPGRRRPTTHRAYSPWHDATMAMDGAAARALGDLGRLRWKIACDEELDCPAGNCDPWPEALEPHFHDVDVAIARTRGRNGEHAELREIEALFVDMIKAARRFVYVENQYFASRMIAEAIQARLAEPEPPEFVLVNPRTGEGWLDETVMGAARAELVRKLREADHKNRFRIYYPVTEAGADIYVHAKIMIVDDLMLRVGSANMNNRSMGLDSECDVMIDAHLEANQGARLDIAALRCDLMAEHLDVQPGDVARVLAETGSLIETAERLRGEGRSLRPFQPHDYDEFAKAVAKSEIADPESADDSFEPKAQHRLLRGIPGLRRKG